MTGLPWLAAVLAPWSVAPHPNFSSDAVNAPGLLASVVAGQPSEVDRNSGVFAHSWEKTGVAAAQRSLLLSSQEQATEELLELVVEHDMPLGAKVAFTQFASLGLAELDSPERACQLLESLALADKPASAESSLAEAILWLGHGLRKYDIGDDAEVLESARRALTSLRRFTHDDVYDFPVSRGISWGPKQVVVDMRKVLADRANSMLARAEGFSGKTWIQVVRSRQTWIDTRVDARAASRDHAFTSEAFAKKVDAATGRIRMGSHDRAVPEGHSALVLTELGGDLNDVVRNRASLAEVYMSRSGRPSVEYAEALRLFRTSRDSKSLDASLQILRAEGPLDAIRDAGLAVVSRTSFPDRVSATDIVALGAAADFLDARDLEKALTGALAFIEEDMEVPWNDMEAAWRAVARILPGIVKHDTVARAALSWLTRSARDDEIASRAVVPVLSRLDWSALGEATIAGWKDFYAESYAIQRFPQIVRTLGRVSVFPELQIEPRSTTERLALAAERRDGGPDHEENVRLAVAKIDSVISDGRGGKFSFGGWDDLEVVAAYAIETDDGKLLDKVLIALLENPGVAAQKPAAIDRIAGLDIDLIRRLLPASTIDRATAELPEMIRRGRGDVGGFLARELPIFPEALRLGIRLHSHRPEDEFRYIVELLTDSSPISRIEGCRCAAAVGSEGELASDLQLLLVGLYGDVDIRVRAQASAALVESLLVVRRPKLLVHEQIQRSLRADGILVPLLALHAFQRVWKQLDSDTAMQYEPLLREVLRVHPARTVRSAAAHVLQDEP